VDILSGGTPVSCKRNLALVALCTALALSISHGGQTQDSDGPGVSFSLRPKESFVIHVFFQAGKKAEIKVDSEKNTDVDLFIQDPADKYKLVASDEKLGKDCHVIFTPGKSQFYRMTVINLGPGDNRSKLTYTGALKVPTLEPLTLKEKESVTYQITFAPNKPAAICVDSEKDGDVDLFVYDEAGKKVVQDERISKDCFVTFAAEGTGLYRVEVVNLGPGDNRCIIRHTGEKTEKK
jgi:hypothetical protein